MRKLALALVTSLVAGLGLVGPTAPVAAAASNPKVAIIVGATHGATAAYRDDANQLYAEAIKYTTNVVKVYSPNATWSKVKEAVRGASVIVYLGHGNGWPSPYTYDPAFTTKDGFGLNADLNNDGKLSDYENKYYGEPKIETLEPAPNAVVLLFHLCYASGNSEPGDKDPSLSTAKQRVDNYASAFLRAGARAVIANGHSHDPYYIRALFTTRQTIDSYWRNAPDANDHVSSYASSRSPGYTYQLDPQGSGEYYRSIAGRMSLSTTDVTGAAYASTSGDPAALVVPGNASPMTDGTPWYADVTAAAAGTPAAGTLNASALLRVETRETAVGPGGAAIYRFHVDGGAAGWVLGSQLRARDSAAPQVWEVDDAGGVFSPNGDGRQDSLPLSIRLSEPASWALRVRDGADGPVLASTSGLGDTAALTWSPAPGSVDEGSYRWEIEATDALGNGPLEAHGQLGVDTTAPVVTVAGGDDVTTFTPNGDGSRDTVSFSVDSDEPGSVDATVRDADGDKVGKVSVEVGASDADLRWDGEDGGGDVVGDGRYDLSFAARDRAGNVGTTEVRQVDVYAALADVDASEAVFYPQDLDHRARSVTLSFRLLRPATVSWQVEDAQGNVVRTLKTDEQLGAGSYSEVWDGRDDAGQLVARGSYRSVVSGTNGDQGADQSVRVVADAFRLSASDTTPARKRHLTVTATSAERLEKAPRLVVDQPGISAWKVRMVKVSKDVYRIRVTLRSSRTGVLVLKVVGRDADGHKQASRLELALH